MNTAKEIIKKLVDKIPETKSGEVIDFLLYIKNKKEQELYLDNKGGRRNLEFDKNR